MSILSALKRAKLELQLRAARKRLDAYFTSEYEAMSANATQRAQAAAEVEQLERQLWELES